MDVRQQKGLEIAATCKISKKNGTWLVPSQTGHGKYAVFHDPKDPTCTCPDYDTRGCKCKHIYAVEYVIKREQNGDGTTTVTETISVIKKKTYPQDWANYNKAQVNEKDHFQLLLRDLCKGITEPPQPMGRPRLPLSDMVFSAGYKIYSTFSARRFMSDMRLAHTNGFVSKLPHYNSVVRYLETPALTPVLKDLIITSSTPLAAVDTNFAADSSGFSSSQFERWYDEKYGGMKQQHAWVKAHVMVGVMTNVVTAIEIGDQNAADSPMFKPLLKTTAGNFTINDVSADKAYLSHANLAAVDKLGGFPYIMPKINTKPNYRSGIWDQMLHFFCLKQELFLEHYHQRSNVESTFSMIKAKFGDSVRSKSEVAQKNEVLCKVLCHNICCVISAMYELDIAPNFSS